MFAVFFVHGQEIRVVDNKGTISTVRNNNVYTMDTNPNIPLTIALENDVWIDTSSSPNVFKIWSELNQWMTIKMGRSLFSINTTNANQNISFSPTNSQVSLRQWINMNTVLPLTTIAVEAGDILDIRVHVSEDFNGITSINGHNSVSDVLRFYTTTPNLIGAPTMIETLIVGGDNDYEIAAGSLNQLFTVTATGLFTIGIQVKYNSSDLRIYSSEYSGTGGLQILIYR